MDTIEKIQNAILNFCEGVKIVPCNNGGIQVTVEDAQDIPGVIAIVANVMYDPRPALEKICAELAQAAEVAEDDIQITTNQARCEVYIDVLDQEDAEELEDEEENFDGCAHNPIQPGDFINYRSNIVSVCSVNRKNKTVCISDPYGVVQTIDEEDFKQFNKDLEI